MIDKIQKLLQETLPGFEVRVNEYTILNSRLIAIKMAVKDNLHIVSLSLNPGNMTLQPQVYGGYGGQSIFRKPNKDVAAERHLAMKSIRIPFRKPQPNEESVFKAIKKFAENYKVALTENIDVLVGDNTLTKKILTWDF